MSDAVTGAAQGALKGAALGPVGAIIGGALGFVQGIFSDKAKKYRRLANKEEQRALDLRQGMQRRQIVRSLYLARQEAVAAAGAQEAGGLQSSAPLGAISSIGSQGESNLGFFDQQVASQKLIYKYRKKAGSKQAMADSVAGFNSSVGDLTNIFTSWSGGVSPKSATGAGNIYSPSKTPSGEFPV